MGGGTSLDCVGQPKAERVPCRDVLHRTECTRGVQWRRPVVLVGFSFKRYEYYIGSRDIVGQPRMGSVLLPAEG